MYQSLNVLPGRIHAEELLLENVKVGVADPTASLDSATYTSKGVELQQIISDATYKYIYGQIDKAGFEKEVQAWKERGGNKIIEEYNAVYKK
ncbi:Lipoprotein LipO precursor [compost metagenome]